MPVEAALAGHDARSLGARAMRASTERTPPATPAARCRRRRLPRLRRSTSALPLGLLAATRWTLGREAALLLILTVAISDTFQYYSGRIVRSPFAGAGREPEEDRRRGRWRIRRRGAEPGGDRLTGGCRRWALPARIALGLAVAAVGIVGDLFESLLKRSVEHERCVVGHPRPRRRARSHRRVVVRRAGVLRVREVQLLKRLSHSRIDRIDRAERARRRARASRQAEGRRPRGRIERRAAARAGRGVRREDDRSCDRRSGQRGPHCRRHASRRRYRHLRLVGHRRRSRPCWPRSMPGRPSRWRTRKCS